MRKNPRSLLRGVVRDDYISCDLGASVFDKGKLALVELSQEKYYAYNLQTQAITKHSIAKLSKENRLPKK